MASVCLLVILDSLMKVIQNVTPELLGSGIVQGHFDC